jgi:hypothetical protein
MSTEIVDVNRKAVAMLQQNGNHDEALVSFRRALIGIRQIVTNTNNATNPVEQRGNENSPSYYHFIAAQGPIHYQRGEASNLIHAVPPGYSDSVEELEAVVASPGNLFSVYNDAFDFGGSSHQEIDIVTTLSPVVLFNIALTYHRKGIFDGTNSSKHLKRALQFYSMASSLLSTEDNVTELFIIRLALLNNKGHIHSHLFEENNAIQCRVRLHKALFGSPARSLLSMASYAFFVRSTL